MISEETKREVKVDNSAYRDRFRFLFSVNENIVCERFFKINYFNMASLYSEELKDTIVDIVDSIKEDMKSKSRIHTYYTNPTEVKLTGFRADGLGFQNESADYLVYAETEEPKEAVEVLEPYAVTFKFDFQMAQKIETNPEDGKPIFSNYRSIYTAIWDGTQYPKDVRNSVDLSNSMSQYKDSDTSAMNFIRTLNYRMILGKKDLIYESIKKICDTTSGEGKAYTNTMLYGTDDVYMPNSIKGLKPLEDRYYDGRQVYKSNNGTLYAKMEGGTYKRLVEYTCDPYGQYMHSWELAVKDKTDAYRRRGGHRGR